MALAPLPDSHSDDALALEESTWLRLKRIFNRARTTMVSRLEALIDAGHGDTVRAQHAASILFEVSQVLGDTTPDLATSLAKSTGKAIRMGTRQAVAEMAALEMELGDPGVAAELTKFKPTIPVDAVLRISDPQQALLTKFGDRISQAAADSLGESLTLGEGIKPAAKRLGQAIDATAYRLESIAISEINNAMNASHVAALEKTDAEFPALDLWKQWSAESKDGRTCEQCLALDGQVQKIDADFIAPDGWTGPAPGKHTRCRCRANPWSPRWTEGKQPKYVTASEDRMAYATYTLQAMALAMPPADGAPNRHPFSGILCQLDVPSTKPPGGSGGDCVILPTSVAEKILPSLLGMGVNYVANLSGHNVRQKIGVITSATIEAGAIHVTGVLWDKDFPDAVVAIQAANSTGENVGMSFEIDVSLAPERAGVARIKASTGFTGAAILLRRDAAYEQTRLAASAAEGAIKMTPEELAALLAANNTTLLASVATMIAAATPVRAASVKKGKEALAEDLDRAQDLHAAASKSGYGDSAAHGAMGEHLTHMKAAQDNYQDGTSVKAAAVELTPNPAIAALTAAVEAQKAEIASLTVRAAATAREPERVTLSPTITAILAKADMAPKDDAPLTAAVLNAAMDKAGVNDSVIRTQMLMGIPN